MQANYVSFDNMRHILIPLSLFVSIWPYVSADPSCALATPSNEAALSSPSSQASGSQANNGGSDDVVAAGWYPGWRGAQFPPSNITWSGYNSVKYGFAFVSSNVCTLTVLILII